MRGVFWVSREVLMSLIVSFEPRFDPFAFLLDYPFGFALMGTVCVARFPWDEGGYHRVLQPLDFCSSGGAIWVAAPSVR